MPSFNFKPGFADVILSGAKRQTIRATKRCSPGDLMHLFTGMRTTACRRLIVAPCVLVDYVHIEPTGITFGNKANHPPADDFARLDGFADYDDMRLWFKRQYGSEYFRGYVHRWCAPPCPTGRA